MSPPYCAVMLFCPFAKAEVARDPNDVTPFWVIAFVATSCAVPNCVFPLKKVTVPKGNVALDWPANAVLATVAVSVTKPAEATAFGEADNVDEVVAGVMENVTGAEVLGLKLLSPA